MTGPEGTGTPRGNILVDGVSDVGTAERRLAKPGEAVLAPVRFRGGRSGMLDMSLPRSTVWAEVLQSLRDAGEPAYVEIDPDTGVITELLLPRAVTVESITPTPERDGVQVELLISHARHFLRRSNRAYDDLLRTLETARARKAAVLVTETLDTHEIIDVRSLPRPAEQGRP